MSRTARIIKLVVNSDMDDSPRVLPRLAQLDQADKVVRLFSDKIQFKEYWSLITKRKWYSRGCLRLMGARETEIAPDVFKVNGTLYSFRLNIWVWFFPYAAIIKWLIAAGNNYPGCPRISKIVVKSGSEWRVFNGEWQGYEETNLSWLE